MNFIFKNYPQFGGMAQEREGDVVTCATPMGGASSCATIICVRSK
jgi:hypothetical protein